MGQQLTIGEVSRRTGLPIRTIRFYEAEGVIPPTERGESGYRRYTPTDVRRLSLARRARLLGLPLPDVRDLVRRAFASDCGTYADDLLDRLARQRAAVSRPIAELEALRAELIVLEEHVRHTCAGDCTDRLVAECELCPLIDDERREVT